MHHSAILQAELSMHIVLSMNFAERLSHLGQCTQDLAGEIAKTSR